MLEVTVAAAGLVWIALMFWWLRAQQRFLTAYRARYGGIGDRELSARLLKGQIASFAAETAAKGEALRRPLDDRDLEALRRSVRTRFVVLAVCALILLPAGLILGALLERVT